MKIVIVLALGAIVAAQLAGCDGSAQIRYEWTGTIQGEARRALIWTAAEKGKDAPVVIYFHGRSGDAEDSEDRRGFHSLWPEAIVVYAEGTNFDDRDDGAFGWQIRFPHVFNACNLTKDYEYVVKLLDHLDEKHRVDDDRVFMAGHSSGGFFTLALTEIMDERITAAAALGAYTSFAPLPVAFNCANTYTDGITAGVSANNAFVSANPVPTLFMFGDEEDRIKDNELVYQSDCMQWSYFQNSVYQLTRKNSSLDPNCVSQASFMSNFSMQVYAPMGSQGVPTNVRPYQGGHSWPAAADAWVVDYFKGF